jgi:hypothetical protein
MTRHLATLRAFDGRRSRDAGDYILDRADGPAHRHLVVELHPRTHRRTWLRIIHWDIPRVVTVPWVVTPATGAFRRPAW